MLNKIKQKIISEASFATGQYLLPPVYVSFITTFRCNFHCKSCSIWQKTDHAELSDSDLTKISADLKQTLPRNTFIEINGGEALLQPERVIKICRNLSKYFTEIALNSNGSTITQDLLKKLEKAGLSTVKISLYSLRAAVHDNLRGFNGAHRKALQALKILEKSPIKTEVGILVTTKNIKEIPQIITFIQSFSGAEAIIQPLDESVESNESKNLSKNHLIYDLWPKRKEVLTLFRWLDKNPKQLKNSSENLQSIKKYYLEPQKILIYRCFAPQRNVIVYPNGDVAFCFKSPVVGNLKKEKLLKILNSDKSKKMRQALKRCSKYCRILGCNFSLGLKERILH